MINLVKIPLSVPNIAGNELKYVSEALKANWVSTSGPTISKFEYEFSSYLNLTNSVAVQSGTAGLHLALQVLGAKKNTEIFVPTLTFIASVNPIRYLGAEPIFLDVDESLCIDNKSLLEFIQTKCEFLDSKLVNKKNGKHVIGIVYVHVFGNTGEFEETIKIAKIYNLFVLEDAAEALGSRFISGEFNGRHLGTIGDIGVYSFNGNKIITTGGGGMVVSSNDQHLKKIKYLSTQAKDDSIIFLHNEIGYNYRMTNLQAAVGLAQLELLERFIETKISNFNYYIQKITSTIPSIKFLGFNEKLYSNHWFYSLNLEFNSFDKIMKLVNVLNEQLIEARPLWYLNNEQLPYLNASKSLIKNAYYYHQNVINLPCSTDLTHEDIDRVVNSLIQCLEDFENVR
jgi:perosamine synthetase